MKHSTQDTITFGGTAALVAASLLPDLHMLGALGESFGADLYSALGGAAWALPLWAADEAIGAWNGRQGAVRRRIRWAFGALLVVVALGLCGGGGHLGARIGGVIFGAVGFLAHLVVLLAVVWGVRRVLGPQRVEAVAARAAAVQRHVVEAYERTALQLERQRIARALEAGVAVEDDDVIDLDAMLAAPARPAHPPLRRVVSAAVVEAVEDEPAAVVEAAPPPPTAAPRKPVSWKLPSVGLLGAPAPRSDNRDDMRATARRIELQLHVHGAAATCAAKKRGPVVDLYELHPVAGQAVGPIRKLAPELEMQHAGLRIVSMPGSGRIGLEIPRPASDRATIALREVLDADAWRKSSSTLPLALGLSSSGEPVVVDLSSAPHLLVAGATGQGKSVGLNAMLVSLLLKCSPHDLRIGLIDPKMVELARYRDIPHLLAPPATETEDAIALLRWATGEMDRRYGVLAARGVTDLDSHNALGGVEHMPRIVIVIDEYADLSSVAKAEVEAPVTRLAQKARAAGMHVILATQRPSVDVVTGVIKANFPARCAFKVASKTDSQVILDRAGAESLLGRGDSLCVIPGLGTDPIRVHGAFVSPEDVRIACDAWRAQGRPEYVALGEDNQPTHLPTHPPARPFGAESLQNGPSAAGQVGRQVGGQVGGSADDELYDRACDVCVDAGYASAASLRSKLGVGYNAAKRMLDRMDAEGLLGEADARGARKWAGPQ